MKGVLRVVGYIRRAGGRLRMDPTQLFALVLSISRLLLLVGVYFGSARVNDRFVSTELEDMMVFRLFLTLIVILEALVCVAYIFAMASRPWRVVLASVLCALSVGGWVALASTEMEDVAHEGGVLVFLAGSMGLHGLLVDLTGRHRAAYGVAWLVIVGLGAAFVGTSMSGDLEASAHVEWCAFMLEACVLEVFFFENPPVQRRWREGGNGEHGLGATGRAGPDSALPLLGAQLSCVRADYAEGDSDYLERY